MSLHQQLQAEVNSYLEAQALGDQLGALPQVLRAVVELHAPTDDVPPLICRNCEPWWPCSTVQAIARELGIEEAS